MDFRNHTPFPALAFEGIDQFNQAFHVFALRQTLTWGADGMLVYADVQEPLCEVDEYYGELNKSSLRQESDLCHFKPRCDVIVNATAYAPAGTSPRRCNARLVLKSADVAAPLPVRPAGLNQFVEPDAASLSEWQAAVAHAQSNPVAGRRLIDKTVTVTGPRELVRSIWPIRFVAGLLSVGTFGMFKYGAWRLTSPGAITSVPLRYEYAYGGEGRINRSDPHANRLLKRDRLSKAQAAEHAAFAEADAPAPVALAAFEYNPVGRGYVPSWLTRAARLTRLPAPQIEPLNAPFSISKFKRMQSTKNHSVEQASALLVGFGVRSKVHPARRVLAGTVDQRFAESEAWLPNDFDFAVWNAAPQDQQTEFLRGDESIELTNMCSPYSLGATKTSAGDTLLQLKLPGHTSTLLVRMQNGTMFFQEMKIDTLIVEPEDRKVSIVWRTVLQKTAEIRVVEANHHKEFESEFLRQLDAELKKLDVDAIVESPLQPLKERHG